MTDVESAADEIAGYGADVVVVEPAELRAAVLRRLRGVLAAAGGTTGTPRTAAAPGGTA